MAATQGNSSFSRGPELITACGSYKLFCQSKYSGEPYIKVNALLFVFTADKGLFLNYDFFHLFC